MPDPYIGEIKMFAGNYAPPGWLSCDGQLLAINNHEALFNLIGTTYGGNGETTFALPDLRGRIPVHMGSDAFGTYVLGMSGGVEDVTLTLQQIPSHQHAARGSPADADRQNPRDALPARTRAPAYGPPTAGSSMSSAANPTATGGSQPHSNLQPFLCVKFIISTTGIYPTQT